MSGRKRRGFGVRTRPRDPPDRFHTKTTYMAVVCDSPQLQPLLPQIVLPKYTQNESPPNHVLDTLSVIGFPFEFWHGSLGAASPGIVQSWATRIRSVVNSFNTDAWILLLLDCSSSHLSVHTVAHLRRLGFLIVMIPARLTWLLQVLDVYVFGPLKKEMRLEEARQRINSERGELAVLQRMKIATSSIRKHVVNRDWARAFEKLGAGDANRARCSSLSDYMPPDEIVPALPTLQEFSEIIQRPAHTSITKRLHRMMVSGALELEKEPLDTLPHRAAQVVLPAGLPAQPARRREELSAEDSGVLIDRFLTEGDRVVSRLSGVGLARIHFITPSGRAVP